MAGPVETGLSVMIEQTITIGNIIEIVSIIGGGFTVFATLKNTVANIKVEVSGMQAEIKKLGDILIAQADMRGEMKVLETRLLSAEQDIRELRHGDGFVKGTRGIEREYP
jgi:hypothetical protein